MALSWTMDKIGPMGRTAADCGHILRAIAGGDGQDPGSAGKGFYYTPQYARAFSDLKLGFAPADFDEWAEPECRGALRAALEVLKGCGIGVAEKSLEDKPYTAVTRTIIGAEGSAAFEELIESGRVEELADQKQIAGLKAGLEIRASDYLRAMRIRRLIQEELRMLLLDVDVLVAPAAGGVATPIEEPLDGPAKRPEPAGRGLRQLEEAGNLAGLPALVLPCGLVNGLPVAIQLVGRPFSENLLIALGNYFQQQTDWHKRRPKG
jgi:aspartyl-tRNA(Asn)/glutamyl-tRNA(Gln) amidotransferase subunit A